MSETAKKEKSPQVAHFKSKYAGLTILKKDGTSVRFKAFFDTYKGDRVRVGFLETTDPEVIERCKAISAVESITDKEFKERESLAPAPVYS